MGKEIKLAKSWHILALMFLLPVNDTKNKFNREG